MNRCPITYDPLPKGATYSQRGLKLLNRELTSLAPLEFTADFYPMTARRANIEGLVILAVQVDAGGCGKQKGLAVSSGSEALDNAALAFIDKAEFLPAQRNGKALAAVLRIPIFFRLSDFQN